MTDTVSSHQTREQAVATPMPEYEKRIFKWEDLVSGDLTPVDWLVEDLIPAGGVAVIGGDSGVGKSWCALHIAQCVASGKPVFGQFSTSRGPVVFVDEESSVRLLERRVRKLAAGLEVPDDIPVTFLPNHGLQIDRQDSLEELLALLHRQKPILVIFDPFIRVHSGNENDSQEMSQVMAGFRKIQNRVGCAVVFTHHTRKRSLSNAASQMLRGSTDIRAFVDTHLFMSASSGGSQRRMIQHEKSRYCEPRDPFDIEIVDNEAGTATFLRYLGTSKAPRKKQGEIAEELILEILAKEGQLTRKEIITLCKDKAGERAVGQALIRLYEKGILKREVGAKGQHTYRLAQGFETAAAEEPVLED